MMNARPMMLEDQQQILSGGGKKRTSYKFCRFAVIFVSFYANLILLGKVYSISLLVNELLKLPCLAGGHDDGINTTKLTTGKETVKPTGSEANDTQGCGGFGAGRGPTAWTGSVLLSVYFFSSAFAGALSDKFGRRNTAVVGALIIACSTIASSFVNNLSSFVLLFSVGGGLGISLVDIASISTLQVFHPKHFSQIMGVAASGSGIGILTFGLTYSMMLNAFGWRWIIRLFGLLVSLLVPLCLAYGSGESNVDKNTRVEPKEAKDPDTISYVVAIQNGTTLEERGPSGGPAAANGTRHGRDVNKTETLKRKSPIDWELLRNPYVLAIGLGRSLGFFGYSISLVHMVSLAQDLTKSELQSSLVIILYGVGEIIGRFSAGWIGQWKKTNRFYLLQGAIFLLGVSTIAASAISNLPALLTHTCAIGILSGSAVTLDSVALRDFVGARRMTQATGFTFAFRSPFTLLAPPIAGWIFDAAESYESAFYVGGSVSILGALLNLVVPFVQHQRKNQTIISC